MLPEEDSTPKLSPEELEAWKKKVGWSNNGYNLWKSMVESWAIRHGISYKSALSILYDDLPYNKDGEDFITQKDLHTSIFSYYAEYDIARYEDTESFTVDDLWWGIVRFIRNNHIKKKRND